jgi:glycosyl transferase family 25
MENCPPFRIINLAHRTDRWKDITDNFRSLRVPFERVDAVRNTNGALGCARSHLKALQEAMEQETDLVAIAEDDAVFDKEPFAIVDQFRASEADVLLLGYNIRTKPEPFSEAFCQIKASLTTSCYIAKRNAVPALIACFKGAEEDLQKNIHRPIDIAWQALQKELVFVIPSGGRRFVHQRAGYSDIEKRRVNYRV